MTPGEARSSGRLTLARGAILYGLLTAADAAVVWYIVSSGVSGIGYVSLVLVSVFGLLLLTQFISHLRDLRAAPIETEGEIIRKWQRAELIVAVPSYFIQIERSIFKIDASDYVLVEEGHHVRVVHHRHTLNVLEVERTGQGGQPALAPKAPPR